MNDRITRLNDQFRLDDVRDSFLVLIIKRYDTPVAKWGVHPIHRLTWSGQFVSTRPFLVNKEQLEEIEGLMEGTFAFQACVNWDDMGEVLQQRILHSSLLPIQFKGDEAVKHLPAVDGEHRCVMYGIPEVLNFMSAKEPVFVPSFTSVPLDEV